MAIKKNVSVGIIILGIGLVASGAMLFMEIGLLWEWKLFEVPMLLGTIIFLCASFLYEDAFRDLFPFLELGRFGVLIALIMMLVMLVTKILKNIV